MKLELLCPHASFELIRSSSFFAQLMNGFPEGQYHPSIATFASHICILREVNLRIASSKDLLEVSNSYEGVVLPCLRIRNSMDCHIYYLLRSFSYSSEARPSLRLLWHHSFSTSLLR